jgi:hypothetical protein
MAVSRRFTDHRNEGTPMAAIIGLLIILVISLTTVRIGAVALELTGLSYDVAAFQAQSAFSGAGFTTAESEQIVTHAVRRRIIRMLILIGSVGLVSTGATLIVALTGFTSENAGVRAPLLVVSLVLVWLFARSRFVYRLMKRMILKILSRSKSLQLQDYYDILGISNGYSISRMRVQGDNWQVGKKLKELALQKEGTNILAITRTVKGEDSMLIPHGDTVIEEGDLLTVYGRDAAVNCLFMRPAGATGDEIHRKRIDQRDAIIQMDSAEDALAGSSSAM